MPVKSLLFEPLQVHRPHVGTDPFSTELVLERGNADWFLGSRSPNIKFQPKIFMSTCLFAAWTASIEVGKSQEQDVSVSGACIAIVPTNANIGISAVCVLEICQDSPLVGDVVHDDEDQ